MKKLSPFMQNFDRLPETLGIFPLNNAVVMPGSHLPLNIFESRYLNMIQDAIKSHQLIGMIQPRDDEEIPKLYNVGCAARITRYEETADGRIEINLTGLCRFSIKEEIQSTRGYRLIVPDWSSYEIDYQDVSAEDDLKKPFISALKSYFSTTEFELDWSAMEKLSIEKLFNSLYCFIEISNEDKQLLLEINTLDQRVKALTAMLDNNEINTKIRH